MERRSKTRSLTSVVVRCRVPASPDQAAVHDISTGGCKITTENHVLECGATILLDLGAASQTVGCVMWARDGTAGIKFENPVPRAIVEAFDAEGRKTIGVRQVRHG